MIISVINQKGGVGKTTTTFHLGAALAAAGAQVLLVDLDSQHSLLFLAEGYNSDNLSTIDSVGQPLSQCFQRHTFDFALIDCPPALGQETAAALSHSHLAIAPTPPRVLDLSGLAQLQATVDAAHERSNPLLKLRILLTLREARLALQREYEEQLRAAFSAKVFQTTIPKSAAFEKAATFHQPITTYAPASSGALAYRELAQEVLQLG